MRALCVQSAAQRSKAAARAAKDVSKCIRVLEEIEKEAGKLREVSSTGKTRRAAIARLQAEAREVEAESGILRRQLSSLGDKAKRAVRNRGVQMEASKQALEAARLEYDAVEQEYAETATKIRENEGRRRDATRALVRVESAIATGMRLGKLQQQRVA